MCEWRRGHRGEDPGGAGKETPARLTMGQTVQAEHGRMEPLELEKGYGWGAGCLHEVGGGVGKLEGSTQVRVPEG